MTAAFSITVIIQLHVNKLKPLNNRILNNHNLIQDNHMKKINMEFSDIYL